MIKIIKWVIGIFIVLKVSFYLLGRLDMKTTIEEKSGVKISFLFKTIENDIFHTPGAFDSDYTWNYKLKISESDLGSITNQIETSKFFNVDKAENFSGSIYDSLSLYQLKGFWTLKDNIYIFHESKEEWSERTTIKINKKERTIDVDLLHL